MIGWQPLWSSGQSFWLQIQRSRVRSPALPDFLSSTGSGTGSTQPLGPREVNWGATWMKKSSGSRSRKQRLTAVGTRCADHVTPLYPQKFALTSPTGGGRSVGIVQVRTKATEFSLVFKRFQSPAVQPLNTCVCARTYVSPCYMFGDWISFTLYSYVQFKFCVTWRKLRLDYNNRSLNAV